MEQSISKFVTSGKDPYRIYNPSPNRMQEKQSENANGALKPIN